MFTFALALFAVMVVVLAIGVAMNWALVEEYYEAFLDWVDQEVILRDYLLR